MTNNDFGKEITKRTKGTYSDNEGLLWKWIGEEWVGKPYVLKKDGKKEWFSIVKPEEIDTRYYDLKGNKIVKNNIAG